MEMEIGESYVKRKLRSLCMNYGWSYGVFWRFDPRNHMLTVEDAYYEEHVSNLMSSMLVQVHMLGEGIIGEATVQGQHRWLFNSWGDSRLHLQFSSGVKTIAVIPVELQGVVQFGSTIKIFETVEFLDQAKKFLQDHDNSAGVNLAGSNSCQNGLLTSVISTQNSFCDDVSAPLANNAAGCSFDSLQFPGELVIDPSPGSGHFEPAQIAGSLTDTCEMDDLSKWLADVSKMCVSGLDLEAMLSDDMSFDLGGSNMFSGIHGTQSACSSRSSLTNALDTYGEEKPLVIGANNSEMLAGFGIENGCEAKINPFPNDIDASFSECISEFGVLTITPPKKGLFSELGLDHLLKDTSGSLTNKSSIEDKWPSIKKRKTEACQIANDQLWQTYDSWGVKVKQPTSTGGQNQEIGSLKQCMENVQSRRNDEPLKVAKKRAKPGESTRPRPKDRQLIADRIKDLRDLIPNGSKLSIDALLGRTIKHMLFLQNLNKHADKLKQVNEPKDSSLIQTGSSSSISSGGNGRRNATWAYEVGGSNLLCPIIVEDLDEPGQMLIEMLCEERGYFLEIADIVRGFGLTILKGVMEARNDKIWAHFIVEGNKHVTRMDVFVSLMQILQRTNNSEVVLNTKCEPHNVVTRATPIWGDFQQHVMPLPI